MLRASLVPAVLASGTLPVAPLPERPTLASFEATLARHDSATLALEDWCRTLGLAPSAQITAHAIRKETVSAPDRVRKQLSARPEQAIALRHVELRCGEHVLSLAWNWYLPDALTPDMNTALDTTRQPFGAVIAPLAFRREAIETQAGPAHDCPADTISTHRARLLLPNGQPLAYLVECYTPANLAPPGA